MAIKYTTAKDTKALEALQDKAIRSVQSARVHIQVALVATILHMGKHGDWTVASRLVDGLGNTVNGKAIVQWFKDYGNLSTDDKGFIGFTEKDFNKAILSTLDDAKAKMWWELKVQNPYAGFSAEAALLKVLKDSKAAKARAIANPADAGKIELAVSEVTIKAVLAMANFEAILDNASNDDANAADIKALERLPA